MPTQPQSEVDFSPPSRKVPVRRLIKVGQICNLPFQKRQIANLLHSFTLLLLTLTILLSPNLLFAADDASEKEDEKPKTRAEQKKTPLEPAVEKALADFITRAVEPKTGQLTEHMTAVIDAIAENTKLSDDEKAALEQAASVAVADVIETWRPRFHEEMRPYLQNEDAESVGGRIESWKPVGIAKTNLVEGCVLPDELPVWKNTLETVLGNERFAAWNKIDTANRKARHDIIDEYLAKWAEKSRKSLDVSLKKQIQSLHAALNLPDEKRERLAETATDIVDRILEREVDRVTAMFRFVPSDAFEKRLKQKNAGVSLNIPTPFAESKAWLRALDDLLPPEDIAHWKKHLAQKAAARDKMLLELLEPSLDRQQQELEMKMEIEISDLTELLKLPKKRQNALNTLSKKAINASEEASKKAWLKSLRGVDDESVQSMKNQGGAYYSTSEDHYPTKMDVWVEGLEKILSDDERDRIRTDQETRDNRQWTALGMIALAELDKKIAFTEAQREKLESLLIESAKTQPTRIPTHGHWSFSTSHLYSSGKGAKQEAVRSILDDGQWKRWEAICLGKVEKKSSDSGGDKTGKKKKDDEEKPAVKPELPEIEQVLAEYLFEKGNDQRDKLRADMMVRVEDLSRVLALPPETVAEINTAAKGAIEENLDSWKASQERYTRSAMKSATRQNVKKVLDGRRSSYSSSTKGPETAERWTSALGRLLTEEQMKSWQSEIDAREEYYKHAIAMVNLIALDQSRKLTQAQFDKLKPLVEEVIDTYHVDIKRYFSRSWYLQSYYCALPFAAIPEETAKEILTPAQWTALAENDLPKVQSYWDNILEQHERRVKAAKGDENAVNFQRRIIIAE